LTCGGIFSDHLVSSNFAAVSAINAVITIAIRLRYDYDPTTTHRVRLLPFDVGKNEHFNFRRSRIVVESQLL